MMTEEEYNKMVQEREEYKRKMLRSQQETHDAINGMYKNLYTMRYKMVNMHKPDEKPDFDSVMLPTGLYDFYDGEEKRVKNFWKRLKKKLFG